ncbi:MAG: hypothetical protein IT422_03130 [Pirellulaceae bacterium]|nr:hypothetical protein [Pirellulaceae bacterium]
MIPHLPADLLGKVLAGYRQLANLDFEQEDHRWLALIWVNTANDELQRFTRADRDTNEQVHVLVEAIGEVLAKLNEHAPLTIPPEQH